MSQAAAPDSGHARRVHAPSAAPGSVFYGLMVATWTLFFTLLVVSPETLEDVYDWLRGLALVWEILMWIALFPWAITYVAWETSWEQWLRVVLVVLFGAVHLAICMPRERRAG
jgi:hypothetical protein